ncbi:hypothetical protein FACS189487_10510 [Campylobacterota bacterium]|nr:hypothetical protein FACS189487_10510 [Campylobacterota bacterium]
MPIEIKTLKIFYENAALVDVSFSIDGALGIVGRSGSGKSLTLKALLNLLPSKMSAEIEISSPFALERGKTVAYIPQNPFTALSPMSRVKDQFFTPKIAAKRLLERVCLETTALDRFPAELSGGQLQRAIIAIALASNPRLLLLDEPTTALDSKNKEAVLEILSEIKSAGVSIIFVSHDIKSVSAVCDHIAVIDTGRVVEAGGKEAILHGAKAALTRELISSDFTNREFRS